MYRSIADVLGVSAVDDFADVPQPLRALYCHCLPRIQGIKCLHYIAIASCHRWYYSTAHL